MRLETVAYTTKKNGPYMKGILVNEGDGPILDMQGATVKEVWDYKRVSELVVNIPDEFGYEIKR